MKKLSILAALIVFPILVCGQENPLDEEFASQTGTAYTIILDDSGSMQANNKFTQARNAFLEWVETIPDGNTWAFFALNNTGISLPFTKNGKEKAKNALLSASPRGGTPIVRTLALALNNIRKRRNAITPYERHVVVILTDGHETAHPMRNRGVQKALQELRAENVEVYGIGFHGEGDYMDGHATHYFMANDKEQLSKGLATVGAEVPIDVEFEISEDEQKAMDQLAAKLNPATVVKNKETSAKSNPENGGAADAFDFEEENESGGTVVLMFCVLLLIFYFTRSLLKKK